MIFGRFRLSRVRKWNPWIENQTANLLLASQKTVVGFGDEPNEAGDQAKIIRLVGRRGFQYRTAVTTKILRFGVLLVIGLLGAGGRPVWAQSVMTWTVDGVARQALVFLPPSRTPKVTAAKHPGFNSRGDGGTKSTTPEVTAVKHPLIFAFHGHGGVMQNTAQQMHLQDLWPEAIVVYPQGLPTKRPNDPPQVPLEAGWQFQAGDYGDRDLKFFDAMLATLQQNNDVDNSRIYATGFSNGAFFSYVLWAMRGQTLAALGICAGAILPSVHPSPSRPVIVIAGQNDQNCLFANQQHAIETDRQLDNATGPGQACGPICTFYPSSTQTPVQTHIHPQGHVYPSWAPQRIVDFLKAYKL